MNLRNIWSEVMPPPRVSLLKVWLIEQGRGQQKGPLPWSRWGSSEGWFQPRSSLGDDQDLKTEV